MAEKPTSHMVQTIVRWCVLALLGYALWHSYSIPPAKQAENARAAQMQAMQEAAANCEKKRDFPHFTIPLLPVLNESVKTEDVKQGTGNPAFCGQKVSVKYSYLNDENQAVDNGNVTALLGEGRLPRGVELGLLGMRVGGERKIVMPPLLTHAALGEDSLPQKLEKQKHKGALALVTLTDAAPPSLPASAFPLRAVNLKAGNGKTAYCGDKASVAVTLWKLDGTSVGVPNEGKSLDFTIGSSTLPYGIEQTLPGMMEGSEMMVILPPAYAKPLVEQASPLLPLPENEIVVAQIALLHIADFPAKENPAGAGSAKPQPPVTNEHP